MIFLFFQKNKFAGIRYLIYDCVKLLFWKPIFALWRAKHWKTFSTSLKCSVKFLNFWIPANIFFFKTMFFFNVNAIFTKKLILICKMIYNKKKTIFLPSIKWKWQFSQFLIFKIMIFFYASVNENNNFEEKN